MKFSVASLPWILLISLNAQASERDWKCLSALQEELTRSNCVGRAHPVGGTKKEGISGAFACGFLHCKGESALVGTNYYSFQDRAVGNQVGAAPLCFHVEGKTYAFDGLKEKSGRITLTGIIDQVSPNGKEGVCRIPSPLGIHVAKDEAGRMLRMTQVKAQSRNPRLKQSDDSATRACDDSVRTKIGAAAYSLGYKTAQNAQAIDPGRYVTAFALCRGIPDMKAFQEGTAAARAAAAHLK